VEEIEIIGGIILIVLFMSFSGLTTMYSLKEQKKEE
jgi:hypothetical protein